MNTAFLSLPRILLATCVILLMALKLLAPGEIAQIQVDVLMQRLGSQLAARNAGKITFEKRRELSAMPQLSLEVPGCNGPVRFVAVSTQEDLRSAAQIAMPPNLALPRVSVFAQGREYFLDERLVMRIAAVRNYLALKFGLTDLAPSGTLLLVIRDAACPVSELADWPRLWAFSGSQNN